MYLFLSHKNFGSIPFLNSVGILINHYVKVTNEGHPTRDPEENTSLLSGGRPWMAFRRLCCNLSRPSPSVSRERHH